MTGEGRPFTEEGSQTGRALTVIFDLPKWLIEIQAKIEEA